MKGLSAKARVALGLVGLTLSVVLLAAMLDLVPDRIGAVREGRAALAEVLASSSAGWLDSDDLRQADQTLRLAVERSDDLLSAAMRRNDGQVLLHVGEHEGRWQHLTGVHSTDSQIRVPVLSGERRWGELELRFRPLAGSGAAAVLGHPLVLLTGFVAVACFFAFYFYLSKALAQLDPSKAVPGRVRSALDTMAEGLLVIDRGGRIVLANRAFATMVGLDTDRLVGQQPASLAFEGAHGPGDAAPRFPWIRALVSGAEEYGVPMRLCDATGARRALMVNCSPVMGASGRPGGVLVSFDDVTELEARGEELREAKDEADQANRAKSEFLANMSHEIRTPMNAILGFTEVLRRGYQKDDGESRKYLNTIHSSGTHLLDLINDILDLSKVESGHLEVEQIPVAPHRVIREVVKVLGVKAREKGVELEFRAEGPLPETVLSDPARLRQIVTNLVGNAIKFTEQGSVGVTARLDRSGGEPALEIAVRDSGIGIAPDKLDTVFEAFAQADTSVTRRFGGTGLGLPISRRFARAMGGDITVASVPGEGSTFTVRLGTGPLDGVSLLTPAEIAGSEDAVAEAGTRTWSFAPARVLVVDDAPENRALLAVVLNGTGLELTQAENGQEALDRATETVFDIVLMDMQMPVMDGYTATRRLRERGFEAPVLALTAHAMKGYEQECRAAGCDDFVTKPIDIDVLMEALARWLPEQARAGQAPEGTAAGVRPAADRMTDASTMAEPARKAGPAPVDAAAMAEPAPAQTAAAAPLVSALAHNPRMRPIVAMFAERLAASVADMREDCARGDLESLAEQAHWLKGSAGTVGFTAFTDPARALEDHARAGDGPGAAAALTVVEALAARVQVEGDEDGSAPDTRPPAPQVAEPAGPPVVSALAGDPRMHPIIRMFVERLVDRLASVDGAQDLDALADMGHWLRGSAGTVGYGDFTGPARDLEVRARAGDAEGASRALAALRALASRVEPPPLPAHAGAD